MFFQSLTRAPGLAKSRVPPQVEHFFFKMQLLRFLRFSSFLFFLIQRAKAQPKPTVCHECVNARNSAECTFQVISSCNIQILNCLFKYFLYEIKRNIERGIFKIIFQNRTKICHGSETCMEEKRPGDSETGMNKNLDYD